MSKSTIRDFIEFAIREERNAAALYYQYAKEVKSRTTRNLLESMAAMESGHELKLQSFLEGGAHSLQPDSPVPDLHISDFQAETPLSRNAKMQEVMVFAIKAEENAVKLYTSLAALPLGPDIQGLFKSLAEEEKKHKFDLESEYEKEYMQWN